MSRTLTHPRKRSPVGQVVEDNYSLLLEGGGLVSAVDIGGSIRFYRLVDSGDGLVETPALWHPRISSLPSTGTLVVRVRKCPSLQGPPNSFLNAAEPMGASAYQCTGGTCRHATDR
jgi:hypothetical protein